MDNTNKTLDSATFLRAHQLIADAARFIKSADYALAERALVEFHATGCADADLVAAARTIANDLVGVE